MREMSAQPCNSLLRILLQVNIAARVAAIAPGKIDALSAFEGVYTTHYVSKVEGAPAKNGPTLTIKVSGGAGFNSLPTLLIPSPLFF